MTCMASSPAGPVLGRPARYCPGPCHSWKSLPGGPAPNTFTSCERTGAAAAPRSAVRVASAAAAAAAPVATAAGVKACCGGGAVAGTGAVAAGAGSGAGVGAAAAAAGVFGLSAGALFGLSSAVMVPVYGLMAFFPRLQLTRSLLLNSSALYVSLSLLYSAVLLGGAWQAGLGSALGAVVGSLTSAVAGGGGSLAAAAALDLSPLARMFAAPMVTLCCWLHLLALDALMAREIALDGIRTGTPTAHSVLLCFFFGPTGLLSHALTRLLRGRASS